MAPSSESEFGAQSLNHRLQQQQQQYETKTTTITTTTNTTTAPRVFNFISLPLLRYEPWHEAKFTKTVMKKKKPGANGNGLQSQ